MDYGFINKLYGIGGLFSVSLQNYYYLKRRCHILLTHSYSKILTFYEYLQNILKIENVVMNKQINKIIEKEQLHQYIVNNFSFQQCYYIFYIDGNFIEFIRVFLKCQQMIENIKNIQSFENFHPDKTEVSKILKYTNYINELAGLCMKVITDSENKSGLIFSGSSSDSASVELLNSFLYSKNYDKLKDAIENKK